MSRIARVPSLLLLTAVVVSTLSCQDRNAILAPADAEGLAVQAARAADAPDLDGLARYRDGYGPRAAQVGGAVLGPAGGTLRVGDFEVVVPAGALEADQQIRIVTLPPRGKERHAGAHFLPHGLTFKTPVILRVPLEATESAGSNEVHVLWWRAGAWDPRPSRPTADGRLETRTDHFSLWGVQRFRGLTIIGG